MNKVNLCWVISDGRKGHEIQSETLAKYISNSSQIYRFSLRQPWESFAPRIIPGFEHGINWHNDTAPVNSQKPSIIISTGRKAAAVAKFICQKFKHDQHHVKHIQILNPKDSFKNYDLVLIPEHDNKTGTNVIAFLGSIHPYDSAWFNQDDDKNINQIAVVIGNPPSSYFKKEFANEIIKVRSLYPDKQALVCGSPRLKNKNRKLIQEHLYAEDEYWFDQNNGNNPYQKMLHSAPHIFVTSDSINMMNECASSEALVTILARKFVPSKKHQRFINSIESRWNDFDSNKIAFEKTNYAAEQIINDSKFQKLLNSPASSNSG